MGLKTEAVGEGNTIVWLDRPERHNALDLATVDALHAVLDQSDRRSIVLASQTPGMFCSGADRKIGQAERRTVSDRLYALYERLRASQAIVMAAVDGPCVGGGAQLLLASDIRFCSPSGSVRFVGPGHGLTVGAWGLPLLVGRGRALELCLSARAVGADEAFEIGLVDRLVEDPVAAARALVTHIDGLDAAAVARTKRVVEASLDRPSDALALERDENVRSWSGHLS